MLRHVFASPQLTQSVLSKAIAVELLSSRFAATASSTSRCFSSSTATKASWGATQQKRRHSMAPAAAAASRLPVVNGQSIPLHVKDLMPHHKQQYNNSSSAAVAQQRPARNYESDLIVVLDMDECLIHSQFLNSASAAQVYAHQLFNQRRNNTTNNNTATAAVDSFRFTLPDGELVHVNVRPGLHEFLQKVCSKYETHIFTAAVPVYADPLLDTLDPTGTLFAGRHYRDSCVYDPMQGAHVKNLSKLPLDQDSLDRVVLVDNNPLSFLANPNNGILVTSFYQDAQDTTLESVWDLIQALDSEADVRPKLQQIFNLDSALQDHQEQLQQEVEL